jgi:trk system potassium uptake protein TrkH
MDFDIVSSISTTISMLGNIGPGVGSFGPFSDFSEVPEITKWFLSGLMVTGRLELLTVIILFTRSFYKK